MSFEDDAAFYGGAFGEWPGWSESPTLLGSPPSEPGSGYRVESVYWSKAASTLRLGDAYPIATYHPAVSAIEMQLVNPPRTFPRAEPLEERLGEVVWVRLDDQRAGLLNRYIQLGREGRLPPEPSFFDTVIARHDAGDAIAIHLGRKDVRANLDRVDRGLGIDGSGRLLRGANLRWFWTQAPELANGYLPYLTPDAFGSESEMFGMNGIDPRDLSAGWYEVSVVLPEGRAERYTYFPDRGYLVDLAPITPGTGTPTLRAWRVPEGMRHILASATAHDRADETAAIGGAIVAWLAGAWAFIGLVRWRLAL